MSAVIIVSVVLVIGGLIALLVLPGPTPLQRAQVEQQRAEDQADRLFEEAQDDMRHAAEDARPDPFQFWK